MENNINTPYVSDTGWSPEWPELYCDDCGANAPLDDSVIIPSMPIDVQDARKGTEGVLCYDCADRLLGNQGWNGWEDFQETPDAYAARIAEKVPSPYVLMSCEDCGMRTQGTYEAAAIARHLAEHLKGKVEVVRFPSVSERREAAGLASLRRY